MNKRIVCDGKIKRKGKCFRLFCKQKLYYIDRRKQSDPYSDSLNISSFS